MRANEENIDERFDKAARDRNLSIRHRVLYSNIIIGIAALERFSRGSVLAGQCKVLLGDEYSSWRGPVDEMAMHKTGPGKSWILRFLRCS